MPAKSKALTLLEALGPMTAAELAEEAGIAVSHARAMIATCKNRKLVYVQGYRREAEYGCKIYPRAIYALGSEPDAKKMGPMSVRQYNERHRIKKGHVVASVFNLGLPVEKRRLTTKKRNNGTERTEKPLDGA